MTPPRPDSTKLVFSVSLTSQHLCQRACGLRCPFLTAWVSFPTSRTVGAEPVGTDAHARQLQEASAGRAPTAAQTARRPDSNTRQTARVRCQQARAMRDGGFRLGCFASFHVSFGLGLFRRLMSSSDRECGAS
eukprot:1918312-Rhodomonas_salina.3